MLSEQRRTQLDKIVQDMVANKEDDSNIRFVVDDFKQKYEAESIEQPKKEEGNKGLAGLATGIGKGLTSTTLGLGRLVGKASAGLGKIIPGKDPLEKYGEAVESGYKELIPQTQAKGTAEKIGKGAEQIGEFFIPGGAGLRATKGAKLLPRIGKGAAEMGAVSTAQSGSLEEGARGAAIGGAFPVAGKVLSPAVNLTKRLLRGIGSGLSGMSSGQLKAVLADPKTSKQLVQQINKSGGPALLRQEAKTIVDGVSKIRQDARKAFGDGLEQLSKEEVPKDIIKKSLEKPIQKYGISTEGGVLSIKNVEFDFPKNLAKAKELISKINDQSDFSGTGIRKLLDDIENAAYKTTGGEAERLSFNAFVKDLGKSIKDSITATSPKLQEMNKAFSQEMQLVEGIEKIFGKVEFKNTKELLNVAQKLESLFNQKGLAPETVDKFLTRIGVEPTKFKAGEAVRQIGELAERSNTIGTNPFEIIRSITAAIVPPKAVREIAIQLGLAENVVKEIAEKLSPATRGALIRAILGDNSQNIDN